MIKFTKLVVIYISIFMLAGVLYFENFRSFKIGLLEYNDSLYEEDFLKNNFQLEVADWEEYKFVKTVIYSINDQNIPAVVAALFSRKYGWFDSFCHHLTITFKGKNDIDTVMSYLKKNLGDPIKTIETSTNIKPSVWYHWNSGDRKIYIYGFSKIDSTNQIRLGTFIKSPYIFKAYIYIKKRIINMLPSTLQPNWYRKSDKILNE